MPVNYLLGQRLLASSPATASRSFAYFCTTCGEIWARAWSSTSAEWDVEVAPCTEHRPQGVADWGRIPGSLLHPRTRSADLPRWAQSISLEHLPPAVLRRELEVHLNYAERQLQDE